MAVTHVTDALTNLICILVNGTGWGLVGGGVKSATTPDAVISV